jgi:hypothetical protein
MERRHERTRARCQSIWQVSSWGSRRQRLDSRIRMRMLGSRYHGAGMASLAAMCAGRGIEDYTAKLDREVEG